MTDEGRECHVFVWAYRHLSVRVEIRLRKRYFGSGHDHLEIRSVEPQGHPLPVTKTGYKSLWPVHGEYASAAEAAGAVCDWLEEMAETAEWLEFVAESEQPGLF